MLDTIDPLMKLNTSPPLTYLTLGRKTILELSEVVTEPATGTTAVVL